MSYYADRYWALRQSREAKKYSEFNCLDPDPRDDVPEVEEEEISAADIAQLKLECHALRHMPKLSDEYGE